MEELKNQRCSKHNLQVVFLLLNPNTKLQDKLMCEKCKTQTKLLPNQQILTINTALISIKQINSLLEQLDQFQNKINSFQNLFNTQLDNLKQRINQQGKKISNQNSNIENLNQKIELLMDISFLEYNENKDQFQIIKYSIEQQEQQINKLNIIMEDLQKQFLPFPEKQQENNNYQQQQNGYFYNILEPIHVPTLFSYKDIKFSNTFITSGSVNEYDDQPMKKIKTQTQSEILQNLIALNQENQQYFQYYPKKLPTIRNINSNMKYCLNIKACCRPNPGKAGIGIVISLNNQLIAYMSEYIGEMTIHKAEFIAFLFGLRYCNELKINVLECFSNNELLIKLLNDERHSDIEYLVTLNKVVQNYSKLFTNIKFTYIKKQQNQQADDLAQRAINNYA